MEFKLVISDPETGKSYNREIKDREAARLKGKRIGDEFEGEIVGLTGYKLKISGGSDKSGFPMKKGIHESVKRVLMTKGVGYKSKRDVRKRKRIRGEFITENIVQVNTKVIAKGKKKIEEFFEIKEELKKEKPKEKAVAPEKEKKPEKEEKPAEKLKTEEKKFEKKEEQKPENLLKETENKQTRKEEKQLEQQQKAEKPEKEKSEK